MIFKLRYYVPLSTLKLIYYSMFHSVIQYSLLNWGRASKSQLHNIKILQNRFLRASLFHDYRTSINVLYNEFRVLKLEDMIDMEFVKFVFKFSNNMLPKYFNNYFRSLETIHDHNTRQKAKQDFFHTYAPTKWGKNILQHRGLYLWKDVPMEMKNLTFSKFKKSCKINALKKYSL